MRKLFFSAVCSIALLCSACISIPDEAYIVRRTHDTYSDKNAAERSLHSDGFSLLSWNIYKGRKEGWRDDLLRFCENSDLIALQEACLDDAFRQVLKTGDIDWVHVTAFTLNHVEAGVLTASRAAPVSVHAVREKEPLTGIPKTALISQFALSSTERLLMVVNVHAINFSLGTASFQNQWENLYALVSAYSGPMIITGDFNTWSDRRLMIVEGFVRDLGLEPVLFDPDTRAQFVGRTVDHVYFRGLSQIDAAVMSVTSSDHNALIATFRLADDR